MFTIWTDCGQLKTMAQWICLSQVERVVSVHSGFSEILQHSRKITL